MLVIREMQTRNTMRYHLTHTRMHIVKKTDQVLARKCGNWNPQKLLVGMKNGAAALEKQFGSW